LPCKTPFLSVKIWLIASSPKHSLSLSFVCQFLILGTANTFLILSIFTKIVQNTPIYALQNIIHAVTLSVKTKIAIAADTATAITVPHFLTAYNG
jgi:hypothetical protein